MKVGSQFGRVLQGYFRIEQFRGTGTRAAVVQPIPSGRGILAPAPALPRSDLLSAKMLRAAAQAAVQPRMGMRFPGVPRPDLLPGKMRAMVGQPKLERETGEAGRAWSGVPRPELGPAVVGRLRGVAQARTSTGILATPVPAEQLRVIGEGRPIEPGIRRKMEAFFQADFSGVRVHEGLAAQAMDALAFTIGEELHFAPRRYDPMSRGGIALLGHELVHVVQQRVGRVRNPYGQGVAIVQDPALEAEAEQMGRALVERMWTGSRTGGGQAHRARPAPTRKRVLQAMFDNLEEGQYDALESSSLTDDELVVKVGLDQWMIIHKDSGLELYTDGLIGCIGVVLLNKEKAFLSHVFSGAAGSWSSYASTLADAFKQLGQIEKVHVVRNHGEEHLKGLCDNIKLLLSKCTGDVIDHDSDGVGVNWWNEEWVVGTDLKKDLYVSVAVSEEDPLLKQAKCKKISNLVVPFIQQGALSKFGQGADPVSLQQLDMVLEQLEKWSQSRT